MSTPIEDLAYILHKRAYRETSYLVDLFTREQGVVAVIAKGAKTNKSKFYLNLQLFSELEVSFSGRTELMTLIQADVRKSVQIKNQKHVFCGYYVNELMLRLLHKHDAHGQLFDSYAALIGQLSDCTDPEPLLRSFERTLLSEIGYGLDFSVTTSGNIIHNDGTYLVSPEQGVMELTGNNKLVEFAVRGKTLNDFQAGDFTDSITLKESKFLMRQLLQHYLGGKPLKTRDLFVQTTGI